MGLLLPDVVPDVVGNCLGFLCKTGELLAAALEHHKFRTRQPTSRGNVAPIFALGHPFKGANEPGMVAGVYEIQGNRGQDGSPLGVHGCQGLAHLL